MNRFKIFAALFFLYSPSALCQSLFPEDGTGKVSRWYYNSRGLDVVDKDLFFETLKSLGIKPIEVKGSGPFLQDTLLFDKNGNRLLFANLGEVALKQTGGWTNSIWDYDTDSLYVSHSIIPEAQNRQLKWFFSEGGATISGTDKNGKPYILTTPRAYLVVENQLRYDYIQANKLWPTEAETMALGLKEMDEIGKYALSRAQAPKKQNILNLISQDLEVEPANLHVVNSGHFLHLDVVMLPLGGKRILLNSVEESEAQISKLGLPVGTTADIVSGIELDKKALNEIARHLTEMGFEVMRAAGIWKLPDGRMINLFNGFQGISGRNKKFLVTNTGYEFKNVEQYFSSRLKEIGYDGDIFYLGKFHPYAGIDCMGAIAP